MQIIGSIFFHVKQIKDKSIERLFFRNMLNSYVFVINSMRCGMVLCHPRRSN